MRIIYYVLLNIFCLEYSVSHSFLWQIVRESILTFSVSISDRHFVMEQIFDVDVDVDEM